MGATRWPSPATSPPSDAVLTYRTVLLRALAVGLGAGLLLGLYLVVLVEPKIDDAIALEEAQAAGEGSAAAEDHHEDPLFTRSEQVGGGVLAAVIYATLVSIAFGTVYAAVRHRIPAASEIRRCLGLAALAFVAVALLPALKYPANPPAVGDPDTVNERTVQYLVLLAISLALAVGLVRLSGLLRSRLDESSRLVALATAAVVGYGVVLLVLPDSPDSIDPIVPAALIWDFRIRSLGGLALLWVTLGLGLGWALDRVGSSWRRERAATSAVVS
jgi:predicted cobalt transporter CbtA